MPAYRVTSEFFARANAIHAYLAATQSDYDAWSGEEKGARVAKVLPWVERFVASLRPGSVATKKEWMISVRRARPLFKVTIPVYAGMTRKGIKDEFQHAFDAQVVSRVPETRLRSTYPKDFHRDAWLTCEKVLGGRKYKDLLRTWKDLTTAWASGETAAAEDSAYRAFREWSRRPKSERVAEDLTAEAITEDGPDDPLSRIERIVREWRRPPDLAAEAVSPKTLRPNKKP